MYKGRTTSQLSCLPNLVSVQSHRSTRSSSVSLSLSPDHLHRPLLKSPTKHSIRYAASYFLNHSVRPINNIPHFSASNSLQLELAHVRLLLLPPITPSHFDSGLNYTFSTIHFHYRLIHNSPDRLHGLKTLLSSTQRFVLVLLVNVFLGYTR